MNKIVTFKEFSTNEELSITSPTKGEGGGSALFAKASDAAFGWLGDKFGNNVDTAYKLLKAEIEKQVKEGQISTEDQALAYSQTSMIITEYSVKGKSKEEILQMIKDRLELVKKETL